MPTIYFLKDISFHIEKWSEEPKFLRRLALKNVKNAQVRCSVGK